jgi:hypothetical protein
VIVGRILTVVIGLAVAALGGWLLFLELTPPGETHGGHVPWFAGMVLGGAALAYVTAAPAGTFARVKEILVIVLPTWEVKFGRRRTDAPAPTPPSGEEGQ